jgi:adenosine deaminase
VIPKAELHVHLEGTMTQDLIERIADRNRLEAPEDVFTYTDFLHFLAQYDRAAAVIRTAEDYRDITYEYLTACANEGAVYVELIASPDHARSVGLSDEEHWAGITQGIEDAKEDHGIEGWVLASVVRNFGVPAAERVVAELVANPHPYVVGFNMAGDEANYPAADYAHVFKAAHEDAGLGCSVHAGEHAGPESVRAALQLPGVTRISHGVRAIEDPALVGELAERGVVLEVCPTSNVVLKVYEDYEHHPFNQLRAAGVPVTLGSDDPPYFHTSIGKEYDIAAERFGLTSDDLLALTQTAVYAGFAPDLVRQSVLKRIEAR